MTDPLDQSPDLRFDPTLITPPEGWVKKFPKGIYIERDMGGLSARIIANGEYGFSAAIERGVELLQWVDTHDFEEAIEWCDEMQPTLVQSAIEKKQRQLDAGWGMF